MTPGFSDPGGPCRNIFMGILPCALWLLTGPVPRARALERPAESSGGFREALARLQSASFPSARSSPSALHLPSPRRKMHPHMHAVGIERERVGTLEGKDVWIFTLS